MSKRETQMDSSKVNMKERRINRRRVVGTGVAGAAGLAAAGAMGPFGASARSGVGSQARSLRRQDAEPVMGGRMRIASTG